MRPFAGLASMVVVESPPGKTLHRQLAFGRSHPLAVCLPGGAALASRFCDAGAGSCKHRARGCRALVPTSASAYVSLEGSRVVLHRGAVFGAGVGAISLKMACLSTCMTGIRAVPLKMADLAACIARIGAVSPIVSQLSASITGLLGTVLREAPLRLPVLRRTSFLACTMGLGGASKHLVRGGGAAALVAGASLTWTVVVGVSPLDWGSYSDP